MKGLPPGWALARLDEVADVRLGRQRSPKNHFGSRMRPYLRAANVTWTGLDLADVKEMNFTEDESHVYELRAGDVLVAEASGSSGEVGKPAVWRDEISGCCFQNTLLRVRPCGPLSEFLRYFLLGEARESRLGDASRGVGIHHIGAARLSSWPTPVAPLNEQRRIVAAIEEQFSRLDAADVSLRRAGAGLAGLRASTLFEALEGLPTATLGAVAAVNSGPAFKSEFFGASGEGIRLLRGENIEPGCLRWREVRTWPEAMLDGYEHLFVAETDLILAMDRPVISSGLKLAPVRAQDLPALLVQRVARIRPGERVVTRFLHLALQLPRFVPHLLGGQTGTQLPHITLAGIRTFNVPSPPLEDQRRIVAEVEQRLSQIDALRAAIEAAQRRSAALRRSILERAFRGELVEQDPSDEPASVLLERIAAERGTAETANSGRPRRRATMQRS